MATNDGGPAFPAEGPSAGQFESPGMSLRDYLAAKAMQGMVAGDEASQEVPFQGGYVELLAKQAYEIADAMLAARGDA